MVTRSATLLITCVSRVIRSLAGVGLRDFQSRGSGRVGSGQEVYKSHGRIESGRVGSGEKVLKISRVMSQVS